MFSTGIHVRIHTDEMLGDTLVVKISSDGIHREETTGTKIDDHTIEIITDHFSFFSIASSTTEKVTPSGNGSG
jgi:hypothetical protein